MINIKPIKIKLVEKKIHLKLYDVIQLFKLNTNCKYVKQKILIKILIFTMLVWNIHQLYSMINLCPKI